MSCRTPSQMTFSPITLEDFIVRYCAYHPIGTQLSRMEEGSRGEGFFFSHLNGSYVFRKVN